MAKQQDNLIYLNYLTGRNAVLGQSNSIAISSDLEVGGNLTVLGTMTYVDSEILTSDNYLFMNSEYVGTSASKGGLVLNTKIDTVKRGSLHSASASENAFILQGFTSFATGDILAVVGTTDKLNDGLYEVSSYSNPDSSTTKVIVKSSPTTGYEEVFKVSVQDETSVSTAVLGLCSIAILRSDNTTQTFETGFGSNTSSGANTITFTDLAGANGSSLQTSYEVANTISLSASNGDLTVSPSSNEVAGFSFSGNKASTVETIGANALTLQSASGELNAQSSSGNINIKTANTADIKILSGSSEGSSDVFGRLLLDGNTVSLKANGSGSTLALTSRGDTELQSTHGNLSLSSNGGSITAQSNDTYSVTAIGNSSDITLTAGDDFTVIAGNGGSPSSGGMAFTANGGGISLTSALKNGSGGGISLSSSKGMTATCSDGNIGLTSTDGAITLDANTGTNSTGNLSLDAEGAIQITSTGNTTVTSSNAFQATSSSSFTLATTVADQTMKLTTLGTGTPFSAGSSKIEVRSDLLDAEVQSTFNLESTGSGVNKISASGTGGGRLQLSSVGKLDLSTQANLEGTGSAILLKSTGTSGTLLHLVDSSNDELFVIDGGSINAKRNLIIGEDVTSSSAIISGTASTDQAGAGIKVTVESGVEVGHVLAVTSSSQFGKANATRASSSASELPQNPLGVALSNGSSSAVANVGMSTITGAVCLIQLDAVPSASDLGLPVFLSESADGKGALSMPAGATPLNGLTRVTQIGTLLSTNASTATGLSGSVNLYPVLWNVDYIVDK